MSAFDVIYQLLRVLGAIGLFLYGMKLMSESLQKVAGVRLRNIIKSMIANKFRAVFSGFFVTVIIQASSATTVLMVSFVNAGLLTLTESIGVMMGANIGTTIKLWFIVGLGMKFNFSLILLPLIGLSLPMLFSKDGYLKSVGEFIMGFSLLFLGIDFLTTIIPEIQNNTDLFAFIQAFSHDNFFSILLFVLFGMLLTVGIQSSSATITFTIIMSLNGLLSFELAAAMILGENIGTTVTANIAAFIANKSAKRAALAHSFFNISGVIWMLLLFYPFLQLIDWIILKFWNASPFTNQNYIPIALCFFHTLFNLINTLLWIGLIPLMVKILHFLIPEKKKKEKFILKNINSGLLSTSELSVELVLRELYTIGIMNADLFRFVPDLLLEKEEKKYEKMLLKISKLDVKLDKKMLRLMDFLTSFSQRNLSENGALELSNLYKIIEYFEKNKNICFNMFKIIVNKNKSKIWFNQPIREQLLEVFELVNETFDYLKQNSGMNKNSMDTLKNIEVKMEFHRQQQNIEQSDENTANPVSTEAKIIYKQLFVNCEHLIDSTTKIINLKTN